MLRPKSQPRKLPKMLKRLLLRPLKKRLSKVLSRRSRRHQLTEKKLPRKTKMLLRLQRKELKPLAKLLKEKERAREANLLKL